MAMNRFIPIFLLFFVIISCNRTKTDGVGNEILSIEENPPMPGFDVEGSDPVAIMLADKVMAAMGGRKAWDETRAIAWTFFEKRRLIWDKHTGDVRIDFLDSDEKIIVNIHSLEGKVQKNGEELTNPDSLARYLNKGKSIWINDSYWLLMPFKLKDTGVTLHYIGEDTTQAGKESQLFQMTFKEVGDTPDNVYNIWVDNETYLVSQWAFFRSSSDTSPTFVNPWTDYKKYGDILLSGDRGRGKLSDIKVLEKVPGAVFRSFEKTNI